MLQNQSHKLLKYSLTKISNLFKLRYLDYHNYSKKIEEVVNIQIQAEQQAAQDYLNLAVSFLHPLKSLHGAGGFFFKMYKEEIDHMEKLIRYQLLRGGLPNICGVDPPSKNKNTTLLDAFKQSYKMEIEITKLLEQGVVIAEGVKDYHYAEFVTSVFLTEQIQSIHEISSHVAQLTALGNNHHALYHYDWKLAKMYPYSVKI
ncbi:ferritin-2 heavy chain-like [Trichoplusia ni]|uniref:Ferritin n=1 Tax=Trichoplusia ni TaxID=7111 RepID=A0A7E5X446_TRINI|nr:ferritin-2 heavy chain-like [Trichoplusia ni]